MNVNSTATHNVMASRFAQEGKIVDKMYDDGETKAGKVILDYMKREGIINVAVVVSRWYGGTKLHNRRWPLYEKATQSVLVKAGISQGTGEAPKNEKNTRSATKPEQTLHKGQNRHIQNPNTPMGSQRSTLLIHDSTCVNKAGKIHRKGIIEGETISMCRASTIEEVTDRLTQPQGHRDNILISIGINNLRNEPVSVVQDKLETMAQIGVASYPNTRLCISTILPNRYKEREVAEVNAYLVDLAKKIPNMEIVDLHTVFKQGISSGEDLMQADHIHPTKAGIFKIANSLKCHLHPEHSTSTSRFPKSQNSGPTRSQSTAMGQMKSIQVSSAPAYEVQSSIPYSAQPSGMGQTNCIPGGQNIGNVFSATSQGVQPNMPVDFTTNQRPCTSIPNQQYVAPTYPAVSTAYNQYGVPQERYNQQMSNSCLQPPTWQSYGVPTDYGWHPNFSSQRPNIWAPAY
jgi:lysophospholipase L1-like esterase